MARLIRSESTSSTASNVTSSDGADSCMSSSSSDSDANPTRIQWGPQRTPEKNWLRRVRKKDSREFVRRQSLGWDRSLRDRLESDDDDDDHDRSSSDDEDAALGGPLSDDVSPDTTLLQEGDSIGGDSQSTARPSLSPVVRRSLRLSAHCESLQLDAEPQPHPAAQPSSPRSEDHESGPQALLPVKQEPAELEIPKAAPAPPSTPARPNGRSPLPRPLPATHVTPPVPSSHTPNIKQESSSLRPCAVPLDTVNPLATTPPTRTSPPPSPAPRPADRLSFASPPPTTPTTTLASPSSPTVEAQVAAPPSSGGDSPPFKPATSAPLDAEQMGDDDEPAASATEEVLELGDEAAVNVVSVSGDAAVAGGEKSALDLVLELPPPPAPVAVKIASECASGDESSLERAALANDATVTATDVVVGEASRPVELLEVDPTPSEDAPVDVTSNAASSSSPPVAPAKISVSLVEIEEDSPALVLNTSPPHSVGSKAASAQQEATQADVSCTATIEVEQNSLIRTLDASPAAPEAALPSSSLSPSASVEIDAFSISSEAADEMTPPSVPEVLGGGQPSSASPLAINEASHAAGPEEEIPSSPAHGASSGLEPLPTGDVTFNPPTPSTNVAHSSDGGSSSPVPRDDTASIRPTPTETCPTLCFSADSTSSSSSAPSTPLVDRQISKPPSAEKTPIVRSIRSRLAKAPAAPSVGGSLEQGGSHLPRPQSIASTSAIPRKEGAVPPPQQLRPTRSVRVAVQNESAIPSPPSRSMRTPRVPPAPSSRAPTSATDGASASSADKRRPLRPTVASTQPSATPPSAPAPSKAPLEAKRKLVQSSANASAPSAPRAPRTRKPALSASSSSSSASSVRAVEQLSEAKLQSLTLLNTRNNQAYFSPLEKIVVRKEGENRPESPGPKVKKAVVLPRAGLGKGRALFDPPSEERDASEEEEDQPAPTKHVRGPGDVEDYATPLKAVRATSSAKGKAKAVRGSESPCAGAAVDGGRAGYSVRWNKGLVLIRAHNSLAPEPQHRSRPTSSKPAIKPVPPLDAFGNFEPRVPLAQLIKRTLVTYTKVIYDDDLPAPPVAKKGRR